MVKCLTHGLRGFNGAVQRRLATLTVTMLISSCWQLSSEVKLRRIFDVCKRWANSGFACICKEKSGLIREATRAIRSLLVWNAVLTSCIEIYYEKIHIYSEKSINSFVQWNKLRQTSKTWIFLSLMDYETFRILFIPNERKTIIKNNP